MLAVLGILGLVTGLVFPVWISPLRVAQLYEARAALEANLRSARALAVKTGAPVSLALSEDGRGYAWGGGRAYLPEPVSIAIEPAPITFFPDGGSTGGGVRLAEKDRAVTLSIDPLTGQVEANSP
jgi:general secretion pathway protein H